MTEPTPPAKDQPRPWEPGFFAALHCGLSVAAAARLTGIHPTTVYSRANSNPAFAQRYADTRVAIARVVRRRRGARTIEGGWQDCFLKALAETYNVTAAAWRARVVPGRAHARRREDSAFARRWLEALIEGYQHLEMKGWAICAIPSQRAKWMSSRRCGYSPRIARPWPASAPSARRKRTRRRCLNGSTPSSTTRQPVR